MCDTLLPLPSPETQLEIVREYNVIQNRIALNNQLIIKLEETAQTIYKQWFIDFEFPNENGMPYKSYGGEMVWNAEINKNIPKKWTIENLDNFIHVKYGKDYKHLKKGEIPMYGSGGVMNFVSHSLYDRRSILIPRKGTLTNIIYIDVPFWSVDTMFYSELVNENFGHYIFHYLKKLDWNALNVGSAVPSMTTNLLNSLRIISPSLQLLKLFEYYLRILFRDKKSYSYQNDKLKQLQEVLFSKMTKVETEKYEL
jgi:type I restriction enzyme S subunit